MANANGTERKRYTFDGGVKVYDRVATSRFVAATRATSKKKAVSNIAYQFRRNMGLAAHVRVTLLGDVMEM